MKRRIRNTINFLGINLLIFAIYLNFFHRDKMTLPVVSDMKCPAFGDSDNKRLSVKTNETTTNQLQSHLNSDEQLKPFSR